MILKFKKVWPASHYQSDIDYTPKYATDGSACFDLRALIEPSDHYYRAIPPGGSRVIATGLAFEVPPGHVMLIFSRSGHGFSHGVRLSNAVGVIDSDYRGEVMVALTNDSGTTFGVRNGERIAQAFVMPIEQAQLQQVNELSDTVRGTGGRGSTGR